MTHTNISGPPDSFTQPLAFKTKLACGLGEIAGSSTNNIRAFFLLFFLTNIAGLNAGLAGGVLLIGRIWDAVNDPLVGWLSDRTCSSWGRRHSWMIYGAIPLGFFSFIQWIVPQFSQDPASNQGGLFWYYTMVGLLQDTAFTAVIVPYSALVPELTQDYNERTSLVSFKSVFSLGAAMGSLLLAQVIFAKITEPVSKYTILGGVIAVISVVSIYLCVWGTRQRLVAMSSYFTHTQTQDSLPMREQIRIVFSNQPFLCVIGIYLFSWAAAQITATILPYFVVNWMGMPEQNFTFVAIAVQGTALLMTFIWSPICQRVGKKTVYFLGIPLWILAQVGLFFLQPGQESLLYGLAVLAGIGISTVYLIPLAMLPDVIDLDELKTGQRREGIFYGFVAQLLKLGIALSLFLVGKSLDWAGFISTHSGEAVPIQPDSALFAIRLMMAPIPALILLCGLVLAYFYPLSREKHAEILLQLWERKKQH